jgi:hypothetical protein
MTNTNDELEFDETGNPVEGNGMKALRAELAKVKKDRDDQATALAKLQTEAKTTTIADALKAHGAKPGLAKYVAADVEGEVTAGSVLGWLTANGADFGWEPAEVEDPDGPAANARRIRSAADNAPPASGGGWTVEKINASSDEVLLAAGILNRR